jgi:hypothetical protein
MVSRLRGRLVFGPPFSYLKELCIMLRTAFSISTAVGILVAALGVALAQGTPARKAQKSGSHMPIRAKAIIGAKVQLQSDMNVGTIEDFVLDDEGVIDYFIVSENGKLVTVPWEAAKFNFEKRTAVINITPEQFRKIPTYTTGTYPAFYTPAYQTEIYRYYNLTPGQERRLERRLNRR